MRGEKQFSDERILGRGDFVREILDGAEDSVKDRLPAISRYVEAAERLTRACEEDGIHVQALQGGCRMRKCSDLQKKLAVEYVQVLGMSYAGAVRLPGISGGGVEKIVKHCSSVSRVIRERPLKLISG